MKPEQRELLHLGTRMKPFEALGVTKELLFLNHAVRSRLPVPEGIVLLDGGWERLLEDGIIVLDGTDIRVDAADGFLQRFALSNLKEAVTVRPLFPGKAITLPPDDRNAIIHTLVEMWSTADTAKRRDIIVSKAITPRWHGTATTTDGTDDTVYYADSVLMLPPLPRFGRSSNQTAWQHRLQLLLRGVRRSLNLLGDKWRIIWADDGRRCWLLHITLAD